ncbi:hypothetical protein PsorP6_006444 [Peronosclerospora sorghi]|uniref:Uncharacterized protein n=1 Tax=Peronosclerospora sorghi TaxID=230839 RepID=A0ACC0W7J5_9STRA|nr:hypothetical protein PsorP6_006444 [Peronosclerospora sorghi]
MLKYLHRGGFYITGSLAPKNLDYFTKKDILLDSLFDKGRVSPALRACPIYSVLTEELGEHGQRNHPKYHQIPTLLRQYQLNHQRKRQDPMQHVSPALPSSSSGQNHVLPPSHNALGVAKVTLFSEKQLEFLHNQIRAYQALCLSMDTEMAQAKQVGSTEPTLAPMNPARTIMEASSQTFPKAEDPPVLDLLTPKWTRAARNLVYIGPKYLDGDLLGIEKKGKLAFGPYNLCSPYLGMNDVALKAQVIKASKAVKALIYQRASKAEREEDRQEKLRLKDLKAKDMEAYGKLVAEAKNERLTYLLSQTNSYLDSIRQLICQHKQKNHVVDEYTTNYDARQQGDKRTNSDDVDDELNYLEIASKGELPRQPLILRPSRPFDASLAVERRRDFFAVALTGVSACRFSAPVVGTGVCSSTAGVSGIEASAGVVGGTSAGVAG